MHLREAQPLADLRLGQLVREAQREDRPLASVEGGDERLERFQVLDLPEGGVVGPERRASTPGPSARRRWGRRTSGW